MNPTIVYGDILDKKSLMSAMLEVDIVIHNAGFASDWGAYQDFYQINVEGTQNVAMAAAERKVKRLVYMSSVAVHGFGSETMMETSPFRYTFSIYQIKMDSRAMDYGIYQIGRYGSDCCQARKCIRHTGSYFYE